MATKTITRYRTRVVQAKRRSRRKTTLPLGIVVPIAGSGIKTFAYAMEHPDAFPQRAIDMISMDYTGYSPFMGNWKISRLKYGLLPLVAGMIIHKGANMIGINRAIANAKIPLIRV